MRRKISASDFLSPFEDPCLERADETVRQIAARAGIEIDISAHRAKHLAVIEAIRRDRDERRQDLLFGARPFILCGLPLKRPRRDQLVHTRRNGKFVLEIIGHPDYGLPFGQDRLIPLWIASMAYRQKNRTISFQSASEILQELGLPLDGPHYRRLAAGFKRIFASTIYFGAEGSSRSHVWDFQRFHFLDRLNVWFSRSAEAEGAREGGSRTNVVALSERFWQEIQEHPIPVEREVVRALANSPGCLDFYRWLSWRCFVSKKPSLIPLVGDQGLVAQFGAAGYARNRDFRRTVGRWLDIVRVLWPSCPARLAADGTSIAVAPAAAIRRPVVEIQNYPR